MKTRDFLEQYAPMLRKPREIDIEAEQARAARGEKADVLLRDETFAAALAGVEEHYLGAWRNSDFMDVERRERAWIAVQLLADVKNSLITWVREGRLARDAIEHSRVQK